MALVLAEPDRTRLARSPLQLVVCQLRFEDIPSVADPRVGLAIHELLGGRTGPYPLFEQLKGEQLEVQIGVGGPITMQQSPLSGWRLFSEDRRWIVSLLPGSVALETTAYTTWEEFDPRLQAVFTAAAEELKPVLEQRLGLRYVDVLTEPEVSSPIGWRGWIVDDLLGPVLHERLGPFVRSTQQQLEIDAGDGIRCTLRHGALPDRARSDRTIYLLDWDVYRDHAQPFDLADLNVAASSFNLLALKLFQQAITPEMLSYLKTDGRE